MINDPRTVNDINTSVSPSPFSGSNQVFGKDENVIVPPGQPAPSTNDASARDNLTDQAKETVSINSSVDVGLKQSKAPAETSDPAPSHKFSSGISEEDFKGKTIAEILKEKGQIQTAQWEELKYEIANKQGSEEELLRSKGW